MQITSQPWLNQTYTKLFHSAIVVAISGSTSSPDTFFIFTFLASQSIFD